MGRSEHSEHCNVSTVYRLPRKCKKNGLFWNHHIRGRRIELQVAYKYASTMSFVDDTERLRQTTELGGASITEPVLLSQPTNPGKSKFLQLLTIIWNVIIW